METYHGPERSDVGCGIPRRFHDYFGATPHRRSDWRTFSGVLGVCRVCAAEIAKLNI